MVKRKNTKFKIKINLFNISILILLVSSTTINALSDPPSLQILIEPDEVNENSYFEVSAYIITELEEIEFLTDVNITFNGKTYLITEESDNYEVKIKAPSVETDETFDIYATKQKYKTNTTKITVKNIKQSLKIELQDYIIPAGDFFCVTVYENNKDGNTVEGANVYIYSYGEIETTDKYGRAYFYAPTDREEITIKAYKLGYTNGTETIKIKLSENIISQIIHNKIFLIFLSTIFLIFVILFVHYRQKKNIYIHAKEISNQKTLEKYTSESDDSYGKDIIDSKNSIAPPIRVNQNPDSKVEEIRISRLNKEKEIVDIKTHNKNNNNIINNKRIQHRDHDWFEGIDEIRNKIDKLTGEIDENGKDKWFEGVDDYRKKIDEKINKKNKKRSYNKNKN